MPDGRGDEPRRRRSQPLWAPQPSGDAERPPAGQPHGDPQSSPGVRPQQDPGTEGAPQAHHEGASRQPAQHDPWSADRRPGQAPWDRGRQQDAPWGQPQQSAQWQQPGQGAPWQQPQQGAPWHVPDPSGGPRFVRQKASVPPAGEGPPWPGWLGPVAIALAFGLVFLVGAIVAIPAVAIVGEDDALERLTAVFAVLQYAIWLGVVLFLPYVVAKRVLPSHLGLQRASLGRAIGITVGAYVVFMGIAAVYALALGLDENSNELLQDTGFGGSLANDIALALIFTVAAPVIEELLFRGVLYSSLRNGFRKYGRGRATGLAAVVSGVFFGLIHVGGGQNDFLPMLAIFGILLALTYQWSGTLYVPIVLHSINNTIATLSSADPSASWVYGLIALGPVISLAGSILIARFVRRFLAGRRGGDQDGGVPGAEQAWAPGARLPG